MDDLWTGVALGAYNLLMGGWAGYGIVKFSTAMVEKRKKSKEGDQGRFRDHVIKEIKTELEKINVGPGMGLQVQISTTKPSENAEQEKVSPYMIQTIKALDMIDKKIDEEFHSDNKNELFKPTPEEITVIKKRTMRAMARGAVDEGNLEVGIDLILDEIAPWPNWEQAYLAYHDKQDSDTPVPTASNTELRLDQAVQSTTTGPNYWRADAIA